MRPKVLCAGGCGKLLATGKGSLPAGQATCRECRRANRKPTWTAGDRNCIICGQSFIARHPLHLACGEVCARRRRNRSDDYHRWKRSKRRSITGYSDITPQQEAELRRRTRKCRLCGVFMTGKPGKPNSKELDHIVPLGMGGTHTHGNVRIICRLCNLKRPKDGSDYYGPVTLWAQVPGVVIKSKVQPKPQPVRKPVLTATCECGASYPKQGKRVRCADCMRALGQGAAALRAEGLPWSDVAERIGYPHVGNLLQYAVKYGDYVPSSFASV